jgi:TPR repeat protein
MRRHTVLWVQTFDYDAIIPVGTIFVYKKTRHVIFKPCPADDSKCFVSCTCGYTNNHGVSCRHVLAVILMMLTASRPDMNTSLWHTIDMTTLFNMNLVSKHKYHAACFQRDCFMENVEDCVTFNMEVVRGYCEQATPVPDAELPRSGVPSAPLVHTGSAVVEAFGAAAELAPLSPVRVSQRPRAWNKASADIMYATIMRLCVNSSDKELVCTTFQSLIATLERRTPRPSLTVNNPRIHTVYDKMKGRSRGTRGGVDLDDPLPKRQNTRSAVAESGPAEAAFRMAVAVSPAASLLPSSLQQFTMPPSPRHKIATAVTPLSQSCNHFRIGLKNLLELANYVLASQELQLAVDLGHMEARSTLALMYLIGYPHMPKDTSAAFSLAKSGFEASCPHCTGILAVCYFQGFGVKQNQTLADKYAHSSSNKNSYIGQYVLGSIYEYNENVESITCYRKSALQGFHSAQQRLGEIYQEGTGVAKNAQQALHFFGLAAQQGNRFSQCALAECYEGGLLVDRKNISEAVRLYTLSAAQGDGYSCFKLAKLFHHGATRFKKDVALAEQWYMKAQVAGYVDDTDALIHLRRNKDK